MAVAATSTAPQSALTFAEKNFRPAAVERDLYEWWERSGFFTPPAMPSPGERPFVMMLPLPNVTGDLHLGHALYHRVMSTFARYRFPGGPKAATRWCVRATTASSSDMLPPGVDALILLTLEELAVNELREPCHHWVRTVALPVKNGVLGDPLAHRAPTAWQEAAGAAGADAARAIWDDVEVGAKAFVERLQRTRTSELGKRLVEAGKRVAAQEKQRFDKRRKELDKAISDNQIAKLEKEIAGYLDRRQQYLFADLDDEERRKLSDKQAELELRRRHYNAVLRRLADEEKRTLERVIPPRYRLRGEARVYPIAVEIRVRGVGAESPRLGKSS
jgi:hypothetical protein